MGYIDANKVNKEKTLIDDVNEAIASVEGWGSIEIYVQDHKVTQITSRKIMKTQHKVMNGVVS